MPKACRLDVRADAASVQPLRPSAPGVSASAETSPPDAELLHACSEFQDAHDKLDRLLEADEEPDEHLILLLNGLWQNACLKAASLPAATPKGRRAKAAMLLEAMEVVLGDAPETWALHEVLAASLARDCCGGESGIRAGRSRRN